MAIVWQSRYETGEARIDAQHRKLVEVINGVQVYLRTGFIKQTEVDKVLNFLGAYVRGHFGYEEDCMERYQCPVAKANKEAHENFLKAFQDYERRYREKGVDLKLLQELADMTEAWIIQHICRVDTCLRDSMRPKVAAE